MRLAVVTGFDYHVGVLCNKVNAHSTSWQFLAYPTSKLGIFRAALRVRTADALILFGGVTPHAVLTAAARAAKVPVFVIWAGSDVSRAIDFPNTVSQSRRTEITHLAVAPWLVDELQQAGIEAQYIPIIGMDAISSDHTPTDRFNVVTYLPEPRRDFYGRAHVYEVAAELPNITFFVVGSGSPEPSAPSNIRFLGQLPDITPVLDSSAAVLRVPAHDGMSLMVLEALARGKFVAWNHIVPGVKHVETPNDTLLFLKDLHAQWAAGKLARNAAGLEFIAATYDERRVAANLQDFLSERIDAVPQTKTSRHVAITGLDLFVTDVAQLNNRLHTGWKAQVLHFETIYDVIGSVLSIAHSDAVYTIGAPTLGRTVSMATTLFRKPRVMHWVGTDIEAARRNPKLAKEMRRRSITHLTEVEWEANELRELEIDATIAPLPPRFVSSISVPPLPRELTLLTYLPRSRSLFYGRRELEAIIRAFSGLPVKFLVVGGGEIEVPLGAAVEDLGWRYSLGQVYERSTALFRFTPRDGLSLMVLEALSFGRHVLWTKEFPFVTQVQSVEATIAAITKLLALQQRGVLKPQLDGAQFVRTVYDRKRCVDQITRAWTFASGIGQLGEQQS